MAGTYPLLTTYRPSYYNEEPKIYPGTMTEYPDGGADFRSFADSPIRRWTILYSSAGGLTAAEAAVFQTLAENNKYHDQNGSLLGFDFTPRGESLLSNVRFDKGGYTLRRGEKAHIYIIEVKLIKRP